VKWDLTGKPRQLNVVLFSGGRGSGALSRQLVRNPQVSLAIGINGYDDGLSTGEVRRFLGDALGPSDFRKNATRVARELGTCSSALVDLLDLRLPVGCTRDAALTVFRLITDQPAAASTSFEERMRAIVAAMPESERAAVAARLDAFVRELGTSGKTFDFSDCSIGNLVFAGSFLTHRRVFNAALDDYCAMFGLPPGLVDNVTDGANAFLVGIDVDNRLLGSEGEIVDAKLQNRIKEIYLIDHALGAAERDDLTRLPAEEMAARFEALRVTPGLNHRLAGRVASADLIIYAPGTQHSSLFPSYLTPGLSAAIAGNLRAVKLLITNIQTDAEIVGSDAVDIIRRAVYYLEEKGRLEIPIPLLITHYLINDPGQAEAASPYVPLGKLDSLEDPRLVRIGHFEEGVTGRHDAVKVLTPFIDAHLSGAARRRVAVWLYDSASSDKISQTLLEIVRAGVAGLPLDLTIYCSSQSPLPALLLERLPFPVVDVPDARAAEHVHEALRSGAPDYLVLFESSGMYVGEDLVELLSHLTSGRLDAVWGSRRLSVRDITESIRMRYRHSGVLRTASQIGSIALSLGYLFLYGRYVSDTLSGARAVRTRYAVAADMDPADKLANQRLLSVLLRDRAEFLEIPVRFYPLSPERVRRTTVPEGIKSLVMMAWWRISGAAS
jgi:2-phospho-L-lactate transferase/gluconeogenesis factor (CofD/UPF0052 family)